VQIRLSAAILVLGFGLQPIVAFTADAAAPLASPVYKYVITPKPEDSTHPGDPVILRVELNKKHFSSGDQIQIRVTTSTNVVKVTTHELGHGGTLRQSSPGIFVGQGKVAGIPFFMRGLHVDMHYTATTADGTATTISAHVTF
jgi:hypothetical protein